MINQINDLRIGCHLSLLSYRHRKWILLGLLPQHSFQPSLHQTAESGWDWPTRSSRCGPIIPSDCFRNGQKPRPPAVSAGHSLTTMAVPVGPACMTLGACVHWGKGDPSALQERALPGNCRSQYKPERMAKLIKLKRDGSPAYHVDFSITHANALPVWSDSIWTGSSDVLTF